MKKFFNTLMAAVLMSLSQTACHHDVEAIPSTVQGLGYKLEVPEAVAKYYNITVSYTDSQGTTSTQVMPKTGTDGICTLEFVETVSQFPAEVKISYNIELSGEKPSESTIDTFSNIQTIVRYGWDKKKWGTFDRNIITEFGQNNLDANNLKKYLIDFTHACRTTVIAVPPSGIVEISL